MGLRVCLRGAGCVADPEQRGQPREAFRRATGCSGTRWVCMACESAELWVWRPETARDRAVDAAFDTSRPAR